MKKKLHSSEFVLSVLREEFKNWDSLFNSQKFIGMSEKENIKGNVIYIETRDDENQKVPLGLEYNEMKAYIRAKGKSFKFVFPVFDSVINQKAIIIGIPEVVDKVLMVDTPRRRFFLGEPARIDSSDLILSKRCVSVSAIVGNDKVELLFPCGNVPEDEIIKEIKKDFVIFSGMKIPFLKQRESSFDVMEMYFVNSFGSYVDDFSDVANIIPKINSFEDLCPFVDLSTKKPIYSEEVNRIILFSVFYLKMGEPVFDLIVYGAGGSGKSTCVVIHSLVFSNNGDYIAGTDTTTAGLVKSYGDGARPGLLISPINFVKVVDELFRRASSDASLKGKHDPTLEICALLERLMSLVLRDVKGRSGSGKGDSKKEDYMRDSFLAADNMKEEVRLAFCSLVRDGGLFRRFSFLKISGEDKRNVQKARIRPSHDELLEGVSEMYLQKGLSINKVKRFSRWFRRVAAQVQVDGERCFDVCYAVQKEILRGIWNRLYAGQRELDDESVFNEFLENWVSEQNIVPTYEGLVRCCAVERAVINEKRKVLPVVKKAVNEDYIEAEKLFRRLCRDTFEIYDDGIVRWIRDVNERGLRRTFKKCL